MESFSDREKARERSRRFLEFVKKKEQNFPMREEHDYPIDEEAKAEWLASMLGDRGNKEKGKRLYEFARRLREARYEEDCV